MSTKSDILAAGREAFEADGEALSLRDVAARAGLTPMAIYRHFENRQALIDALHQEAIAQWRRRVADIAPDEPRAQLKAIGLAFLEFALKEPRLFEAAFMVTTNTALRYPDDLVGGGSSAIALQLKLIDQIIADRKDKRIAAGDVLVIIAALSQGLVSLYRAGRIAGGEKTFRALYDRAMETMIGALTGTANP